MADNDAAPSSTAASAPKNGGAKQKGKGPAQVVEVRPMAGAARLQKRHLGLAITFAVFVLLPILISGVYLFTRAQDQYASSLGFTVRHEGGMSAGDLVGIASQLTGSSSQKDTDVLFEFLQNQNIVEKIDAEFDLAKHYSQFRARDPFYALDPDATIEDKVEFWERIATVLYDQASGLIQIRILAFDRTTAHAIAQSVLKHAQDLINELNALSRSDRIQYATEDLDLALERLSRARQELIKFRTLHKIVDVEADLQSRLGVVSTLQQQLAEALVELDLLALNTSANDPRYIQAQNTIKVIRERIEAEKTNVVTGETNDQSNAYPTLLAEYEELVVNREYAEQTYRAALAALDVARADASRQSSYLAAFLKPTMPDASEYPKRWTTLGIIALFLVLGWAILALVFYSIRDSR